MTQKELFHKLTTNTTTVIDQSNLSLADALTKSTNSAVTFTYNTTGIWSAEGEIITGPKPNEIWYTTTNGNAYDMASMMDMYGMLFGVPEGHIHKPTGNTLDGNHYVVSFESPVNSVGINTGVDAYAMFGNAGGSAELFVNSIQLPDTVTTIYSTFLCGSKLTGLTINPSISYIVVSPSVDGVILENSLLEKIVVDPANTHYDSRENCNAVIDSNTNALIFGCKTTVIPTSVTSIAANAFRIGTNTVAEYTIPGNVATIGAGAFNNLAGLTKVTFLRQTPPSITSTTFSGTTCTIYVPAGCKSVYIQDSVWATLQGRIQELA